MDGAASGLMDTNGFDETDRRPLAHLGRKKLGEETTRYLRDALLSGQYATGDRMAVHQLAESLGVSTMPVREALVTLANEGLLEVIPRRGFRVATMGLRDIEDAFKDESGRLLLSRTAVSQLGERLWEDYQTFAKRDLIHDECLKCLRYVEIR